MPSYRRALRMISFLPVAMLIAGCAVGGPGTEPVRIGSPQGPYEKEAGRIKADPVGYLRRLCTHCENLKQYKLMFYRQERQGLLVRQLGPMEEIRAAFRREPFSVKFEWDDPESAYVESVYVAKQHDDKLLVRERKGLLGLAPQILKVNLMDPVIWGKSKNPITDFGLARVTQRTLRPFEDPTLSKAMTITYEGLVELEPTKRTAHYLHIERPPMKGYAYTRQDFYVDAETLLPSGTDLWLASGELDARYRYAAVETKVKFTDADFRLKESRPKTSSTQ